MAISFEMYLLVCLAMLFNGWSLRWWWVNVAKWPHWPADDWPEGGIFRIATGTAETEGDR